MKKKVILPILICGLGLSACGQKDAVTSQETDTSASTEVVSVEADATTEESVDMAETDIDDGTPLYERFLANKAKVHINKDRDFGSYFAFEEGKELNYTLEELTNAIISNYIGDSEGIKIELDSIEYAYIDCGNDGNEELAIRINTPAIDDWSEYVVIKDINGKLETIYSNEAWSRSRVSINKYGYIYGDGSGGASNHYFEKSYLDAGGNWHYIYGDETTVFDCSDAEYPGDIWSPDGKHVSLEMPLPGSFVFFSFDFNNTDDNEKDNICSYAQYSGDYENDNGLNGYFYCKLVGDEVIYDADYPLKKFFDEVGIETVSIKEINELIEEKAQAEGLTPEIVTAEDAEWENLEYTFIPDIATYNDSNFLNTKAFFPLYFSLRNTDDASTTLHINSDGTIEGSYYAYNYTEDGSNEAKKNEFTGKFELVKKVNDTTFSLKLAETQLKNEDGKEEISSTKTGIKTHTYYVTPPGIDDNGENYTLYLPNTPVSELSDEVFDAMGDYWRDKLKSQEILGKYILFENDGKNYLWYEF